ncbi:MAG: ABC transporter permease subunit [Clostridia bacterium]|nr:ABC transporter permease subunit [Clostridia bacterium]
MLTIIKKEFKSYFYSPVGYVFIGVFLMMFSLFFWLSVFSAQSTNFEYIFFSGAQILTFIISLITMRTFSEERKNGTEQLILTAPISITRVVIAKFIAATLVIIVTELCTFMYFAILSFFGNPHIITALVSMLGFTLLAMSYISFGLFTSSLTEHQMLGGVISTSFFILLWILPAINNVFTQFSLIDVFSKFPTGQIDIADTITLITFTVCSLILTIIIMQRRKCAR